MAKSIINFWDRIQKNGDCWEWTGAISHNGYGLTTRKNKSVSTHRLAYELVYGPIPDGLIVCHKCDNKRCIRPDHLFAGTHKDNTLDAVKKNRLNTSKGSSHYLAKLNEDKVREIRRLRKQGMSHIEIAKIFNIHSSLSCQITTGTAWRHIT